MSVRKFGEKTQNDYIRHVKSFSSFLGRSAAKATPEDLRRYQVHQSKAGTTADHQQRGLCAAVLLQGDAQSARDVPAPHDGPAIAETSNRPQQGGCLATEK
jgi:hypothetical protein